jgi:hypothetical protein
MDTEVTQEKRRAEALIYLDAALELLGEREHEHALIRLLERVKAGIVESPEIYL